jgi:hypothetical protein
MSIRINRLEEGHNSHPYWYADDLLKQYPSKGDKYAIDDVLSINNSRFAEFLPLIYPPELEFKETTDTASFASFLDLYLEFDDSGQIITKIYDKRDDFNLRWAQFVPIGMQTTC